MKLTPQELDRTVRLYEEEKRPVEKVAELIGRSEATIKRVLKRNREHGSPAYLPRKSPSRSKLTPVDEEYIRELLQLYPCYYWDEICSCLARDRNVKVHPSTVCKATQRMGLTLKKVEYIAKRQDPEKELKYTEEIGKYRQEQLVFIDETGFDSKAKNRRFGRAPRGQKVVRTGEYLKGDHTSLIAAISTQGIIASYAIPGGFSAPDVAYFFESLLLPKMNAPPAPNSVVVMDNGSAHTAKAVRGLCERLGVCGVFLPPYTPLFNPIENAFAWIKKYVKRHAAHSAMSVDFLALEACEALPADVAAGYFQKIYSLL